MVKAAAWLGFSLSQGVILDHARVTWAVLLRLVIGSEPEWLFSKKKAGEKPALMHTIWEVSGT